MGSLASELSVLAEERSAGPRVYADANVPAGVVRFMRARLAWDVLFVIEHDDLRRASDQEHFRRARDMRRTLVSLDHDYLDERQYPAAETAGVLVVNAPDEAGLARLLARVDRRIFRPGGRAGATAEALPLLGRKLDVHPDWQGPAAPGSTR